MKTEPEIINAALLLFARQLDAENERNRARWSDIAARFAALREVVHEGRTLPRFDLTNWQIDVFAWEQKNFGEQPEYRRVYGVMEELGELCHARLKAEQGIRLDEDHAAKAKDAVGDMLVFLANLCSLNGWSLEDVITTTWAEVSQRDWTKNKNTGVAEVVVTELHEFRDAGSVQPVVIESRPQRVPASGPGSWADVTPDFDPDHDPADGAGHMPLDSRMFEPTDALHSGHTQAVINERAQREPPFDPDDDPNDDGTPF